MAYTSIVFKHPHTGAMRQAPVGFSWTVLFFGFFPPLFRGDWKWAVIIFLLSLLTMGLSNLVFMFLYNKFYIKDLIGAGFKAESIANSNMAEADQKIGMEIPRLKIDA